MMSTPEAKKRGRPSSGAAKTPKAATPKAAKSPAATNGSAAKGKGKGKAASAGGMPKHKIIQIANLDVDKKWPLAGMLANVKLKDVTIRGVVDNSKNPTVLRCLRAKEGEPEKFHVVMEEMRPKFFPLWTLEQATSVFTKEEAESVYTMKSADPLWADAQALGEPTVAADGTASFTMVVLGIFMARLNVLLRKYEEEFNIERLTADGDEDDSSEDEDSDDEEDIDEDDDEGIDDIDFDYNDEDAEGDISDGAAEAG